MILQLDRIACVRGGRLLFADLSLALGPGEAAVVTGANGVGKSSLLRLAAGLIRPFAGSVEAGPAALMAEQHALDPERSLRAALGFWATLDGGDADAALAAVDLAHLADLPVRLLSTGQRRRAALARIMASGAALWLLDEPATGLDAAAVARLEALIAEHRAEGGAVLVATHQPLALPDARSVRLASFVVSEPIRYVGPGSEGP